MIPNQRDLDEVAYLRKLRADVDALMSSAIAKWGRIPHLAVDPAAPADGSVWVRSTDGSIRFRAAGVTYRSPTGLVIARTTASATAYTNATAVETDITVTAGTAPSITVALDPARLYKFVFEARFQSTVLNDLAQARLLENGVQRKAGLVFCHTAATTTLHTEQLLHPASSSAVAYKWVGSRATGTGTVSAVASASSPIEFWIEDMGTLA